MRNADARRPLRRSRAERRLTLGLKVLLTIVLAAWVLSGVLDFLGRIRSVTIILIGAVFFTYIVHPVVRRLSQRMSQLWAIVIVYAALAVLVGFGAAVILPTLSAESQSLVHSYPMIIHNAQAYVSDPDNPILSRLPLSARDWLAALPAQLGTLGEKYAGAAASRAFTILLSTVAVLATVVVVPILSVYLMLEAPTLIASFLGMLPPRARPKATAVLHDLDKVLGGFIRGQFLSVRRRDRGFHSGHAAGAFQRRLAARADHRRPVRRDLPARRPLHRAAHRERQRRAQPVDGDRRDPDRRRFGRHRRHVLGGADRGHPQGRHRTLAPKL
jgi:hypothetical protein